MPLSSSAGTVLGSVGAVTGNAAAGQVLTATSSTAADWENRGLVLLSSTTLQSDGTFDVANISQAYNDLLLVLITRGTAVATIDSLLLRFNNDSAAANYEGEELIGNLLTASAANRNAGAFAGIIIALSIPAASSTANKFGVCEAWVHGYTSTSWLKNAMGLDWANYNSASGREVDFCAGQWSSTAAITRVQVLGLSTANLLAGSTLRIYGRL